LSSIFASICQGDTVYFSLWRDNRHFKQFQQVGATFAPAILNRAAMHVHDLKLASLRHISVSTDLWHTPRIFPRIYTASIDQSPGNHGRGRKAIPNKSLPVALAVCSQSFLLFSGDTRGRYRTGALHLQSQSGSNLHV
jgi:hypothetical protein